jgi:acyl-CoA thioesterase-1
MKGFLGDRVFTAYGAIAALRNGTIALIFSVGLLGGAVAAEPVTVVALGDSLTAGYGLPPEEGLVPQLEGWLKEAGVDAVVQNAGVSGDTTAGGASRVDWALGPDADALIVTLGGNDMMRGLPPEEVEANLTAILANAKERGLPILLVGMQAPTNFGPEYKAAFDALYPALATEYGALLLPDFFDGFRAAGAELTDPASFSVWMQADGIHPNAEGVKLIVQALGPKVQELLASVAK